MSYFNTFLYISVSISIYIRVVLSGYIYIYTAQREAK